MSTTTPTREQQRYTDAEVAHALTRLQENAGNVERTARELDIPPSTIRDWRDQNHRTAPQELVTEQKRRRAAAWDALQDAGVAQALARLPDASARDAAIIAGIATDKAALLRADTPSTDPATDAKLDLFRQAFGAARVIAGELHIHLPAPTAPEPAPAPLQVTPLPDPTAGESGNTAIHGES